MHTYLNSECIRCAVLSFAQHHSVANIAGIGPIIESCDNSVSLSCLVYNDTYRVWIYKSSIDISVLPNNHLNRKGA